MPRRGDAKTNCQRHPSPTNPPAHTRRDATPTRLPPRPRDPTFVAADGGERGKLRVDALDLIEVGGVDWGGQEMHGDLVGARRGGRRLRDDGHHLAGRAVRGVHSGPVALRARQGRRKARQPAAHQHVTVTIFFARPDAIARCIFRERHRACAAAPRDPWPCWPARRCRSAFGGGGWSLHHCAGPTAGVTQGARPAGGLCGGVAWPRHGRVPDD